MWATSNYPSIRALSGYAEINQPQAYITSSHICFYCKLITVGPRDPTAAVVYLTANSSGQTASLFSQSRIQSKVMPIESHEVIMY